MFDHVFRRICTRLYTPHLLIPRHYPVKGKQGLQLGLKISV